MESRGGETVALREIRTSHLLMLYVYFNATFQGHITMGKNVLILKAM